MADELFRAGLSRRIIDFGLSPEDLGPRRFGQRGAPKRMLAIAWPDGLAPQAAPLAAEPDPHDPLPRADVVVITWTVAEMLALADVLTPGVNPRTSWYRYEHRFADYVPLIRRGAPALVAGRLASYFPARIANKKVLCIKSELHLNQDGIRRPEGTTLPVADLFRQIIAEVRPRQIITVGTAGGTFADHQLGDVMVTRAARFRCTQEFADAPFNDTTFRSAGRIKRKHLATAERLMAAFADELIEPDFGPPTTAYDFPAGVLKGVRNIPDLKVDGVDFPAFHPMLTTDFFEFGTSTNGLEQHGCGVEMGDAVLGLVCDEMGAGAPTWLVVRNASDPQINGALPTEPIDMQAHWAVFYYEAYGYWTSVMSAIATWALIAP
ncbi:MAG: hypothetical protein ABIW46_02575 [Acidimicrobiales bacterium]